MHRSGNGDTLSGDLATSANAASNIGPTAYDVAMTRQFYKTLGQMGANIPYRRRTSQFV